jgi:hypothetical protein
MFQILGLLLDASKTVASIQDVMTGEARAQTMQPTTLLALIEQGLKVYTSIVKRIFRSLGQEFSRIHSLNRRNPDEETYASVVDFQPPASILEMVQQHEQMMRQWQQAATQAQMQGAEPHPQPPELPPTVLAHLEPPTMAGDYEEANCDIVPVADPSQVTDAQKMAKAQLIREEAATNPVVNREKATRRVFEAAGIEDVDELIMPTPAGPDPLMQANAEAEVQKKKASAMKDLATAEKTALETEALAQDTAQRDAAYASGQMDADAALNAETRRLQNNKMEREMALKERQADAAERRVAAQAKGEVV